MRSKFRGKRILVSGTISLVLMLVLGVYSSASTLAPTSRPIQMAATPGTSAPATSHPKVELMIFSSPAPGISYSATFGIHSIMNKYHPWIKMKFQEVQGTGDAVKWAAELPKKQRDQSIIMPSDSSYWGILAGDPGYPKNPDLRLALPLYLGTNSLVTFNPQIKTIRDLVGKTLAHGAKSWGGWPPHEVAFKAAGIYDKIDVKHIGMGPAAIALRDGRVDASFVYIAHSSSGSGKWLPSAPIEELRTHKKLYYIDLPDERAAWLKMTGRPYAWAQIPAGAVYNDTAFGTSISTNVIFGAFANNDTEIVYEIIKTLFDHWSEFETYHTVFKGATLQSLMPLFHIKSLDEVHPGALKYFKEKGVKVPLMTK